MIKRWSEFIREFIENSDNLIDIKMQEIKDLVDNISDKNIIYEWKNNNDHQLDVAFSYDGLSIKYEFDIDSLHVTKISGETIDFQTDVESIDEGLEIIEKDIQSILGISESGQYDSSLTEEEARKVTGRIRKFSKIEVIDNTADVEGLVEELQSALSNYDKETIDLVIDSTLFGDDSDSWEDWAVKEIMTIADKIMNKWGTEPGQVLNAYDDAFKYLKKYYRWDDVSELNEGRTKSQRYKGRKIPGKYLTKNPKAMKKEIDTYRGKKEYKKDWDADYKSGKGGKGKRVKTKKSASTLAYERMYKNKEK